MNLGAGELIAIAVIILLLFGGSKLKEIMRSVGEGVREFRHATSAATKELETSIGLEPEDGTDHVRTLASWAATTTNDSGA